MRSGQKIDAIVIGSGVVSLGVIIDLAADGIAVAHISPKADDVALRSRWSVEKIVLESGSDQAEQLLELLQNKSGVWGGACLLPTIDPMLRIVSQNLERITKNYVTPVLDWESLLPIVNKSLLYEKASLAGIPTPKILYVEDMANAAQWAGSVQYPVIIKPSQTPEFFAQFNAKVLVARNAEELTNHLDIVGQHELEVMISEIISGTQNDLKAYRCYINHDGQVIAEMCSEKVRSHPPEYGVGIVQRTIPMNEVLRQQGRTLLNALNFRGFATVEFKRDARDGKYKLMEINPRPSMVQRLFRKAGLNFAKLTVDDMMGRPVTGDYSYRPNVYCIHNSADIYHIKRFARRRLSGLREYFSPYFARDKVFLLPPIRDPGPFLYDMKRVLGGHFRRKYVWADVQH